jgi:hypothetical protein
MYIIGNKLNKIIKLTNVTNALFICNKIFSNRRYKDSSCNHSNRCIVMVVVVVVLVVLVTSNNNKNNK